MRTGVPGALAFSSADALWVAAADRSPIIRFLVYLSIIPAVNENTMTSKAARIAARIQQDFTARRVLPGEILGSEHELRARFAVGRETLREAIAILEMRGIGRMRRGRHGGFVVAIPDLPLVARSFSGHALLSGTSAAQLSRARLILERIGRQAVVTNVIFETLARCMATLQEHFRGDGKVLSLPRDPTQRITVGSRRAGQIARNIVAQLAQTPLEPGTRFGSERDLSQRFAVSKSIARQVVRLLEDLEIARCHRGSGRGIFMHPPAPYRPAATLGLYLFTHGATPESSWEIGQSLRIECAQLAAERPAPMREQVCREVSTLLKELSGGRRPFDLETLFLIDRAVESTAGNPLLTLILEGLKAHSALARPRRDQVLARFVASQGERYFELMSAALVAIEQGKPGAAGEAQQHLNHFFAARICVRASEPAPSP